MPKPAHGRIQTTLRLKKLPGKLGPFFTTEQCKKRSPGCLGYIGDGKLPSYMEIIISHDKDPY